MTFQEVLDKENNNDWFRADGRCICPICGLEYKRHTLHQINEYFHLNELCNGWLVKL